MNKSIAALLLFSLLIAGMMVPREAAAVQRYLKIAFNPNLPPYQFLDEQGQPEGMHIEMLDSIAQNRGYVFEYVAYGTNRECEEALRRGKVDAVLGVVERSAPDDDFSQTDILTSSALCMLTRNAAGAGDNTYIAIYASDTGQTTLLSNLSFNTYIVVGNQSEVLARHLENREFAMIGVKDSLLYQIDQLGMLDEYTIVRNYLDTVNYTLLVNKGDRELLRVLNSGIALLKASPQYEISTNRWTVVESDGRVQLIFRRIGTGVAIGALVIACYLLISIRLRRLLQRRVKEQTEEIQQANQALELQLGQIRDESGLRNRIIKYSPNAMLLYNEQYIVTLINRSACAIAGVEESYAGQSALELPVFGEIIQQAGPKSFHQDAVTVENRIIRLGETQDSMHSYRYTMHQVILYGKVSGILLTVQDITKEERAQQAAFEEEKSRMLTRIAAGIAHEIRNPLMSIRTFATLIGSKGDDRQVQQSFARYVPAEVDRINKLIEHLIHYTKPGKRTVSQIHMSELLDECLYLAGPLINKSRMALRVQISESLYLKADRDQIKQIIINLLMNSIEAMARKPAQARQPLLNLDLTLDEYRERMRVVVRDEGIGMPPARLQRCRDPFYSTKENGTGMGLALCDQYMKENGGVMQIESVEMEYTEISLLFRSYTNDKKQSANIG